MLILPLFLSLATFVFGLPDRTPDADDHPRVDGRAPLYGGDGPDAIPDEFVVLFWKDHTHDEHFARTGLDPSDLALYRKFNFGYGARLDNHTRDEIIRRDPGVCLLEHEIWATVPDLHDGRPFNPSNPSGEGNEANQSVSSMSSRHKHFKRDYNVVDSGHAPYGLQMVSAGAGRPRLKIPVPDEGTYQSVQDAGRLVRVYVVDCGIWIDNPLFTGRAVNFGDLYPTDPSPYLSKTSNMEDDTGHGTFVAGVIGADYFGVAQSVTLVNVKVCSRKKNFKVGMIAQAIDDIVAEHMHFRFSHAEWQYRGAVINIAAGWYGQAWALSKQLRSAKAGGINVYVAAGNSGTSSNNFYPCANLDSICVGAVNYNYQMWKKSNFGHAIDILAPGQDIISANLVEYGLTANSGTSAAVAYASGVAAIFNYWKNLKSGNRLSSTYMFKNAVSGKIRGTLKDFTPNTGIRSIYKSAVEPFAGAGPRIYDLPPNYNPNYNNYVWTGDFETENETSQSLPQAGLEVSEVSTAHTSIVSNSTTGDSTGSTATSPTQNTGITITKPAFSDNFTVTTTATVSFPASLSVAPSDQGLQPVTCYEPLDLPVYNWFLALLAANDYCNELRTKNVIVNSNNTQPTPKYAAGATYGGGYLAITVTFDPNSCSYHTQPEAQLLDFGSLTAVECYQMLYEHLSDSCPLEAGSPLRNEWFTTKSGYYSDSCVTWSMTGHPGQPPPVGIDV